MSDSDLIILVIFLICVSYVVYNAINWLDKQTKVEFEKGALDEQLSSLTLEGTPLKDIVEVNFGFKPFDRFKFSDQPKSLSTTIKNKSKDIQIFADWDRSTLTDYGNASRRVIHLNSAKQFISNHQPPLIQVPNPITPGTSLIAAQLAPEEVVQRNFEKNVLEPMKPIVDLDDLARKADLKITPKEVKLKNSRFRSRKAPLEFSLRLLLQMKPLSDGGGRTYEYLLLCKFRVINMPWWDQLPWNPKK